MPMQWKEAYIHWAITHYVYSVIAHIRTVLRGVIVLTDSGTFPLRWSCADTFSSGLLSLRMNEESPKTRCGEGLPRIPIFAQPSYPRE